jgi:transcription elongation GreA/GreB family factor
MRSEIPEIRSRRRVDPGVESPGVSSPSTKAHLKEQLVQVLAADLVVRERAYRTAYDAATHHEAKPENDKDTRALESSYLARGEALRLEELRAALVEVQAMPAQTFEGGPARLGALVVTEEDGARAIFLIAPHGGGARLDEGAVQVITPKSPLGRALLGANTGDDCEVRLAGKPRTLSIVSVA